MFADISKAILQNLKNSKDPKSLFHLKAIRAAYFMSENFTVKLHGLYINSHSFFLEKCYLPSLVDAKLHYFHSEQILALFSTVNELFNALCKFNFCY